LSGITKPAGHDVTVRLRHAPLTPPCNPPLDDMFSFNADYHKQIGPCAMRLFLPGIGKYFLLANNLLRRARPSPFSRLTQ